MFLHSSSSSKGTGRAYSNVRLITLLFAGSLCAATAGAEDQRINDYPSLVELREPLVYFRFGDSPTEAKSLVTEDTLLSARGRAGTFQNRNAPRKDAEGRGFRALDKDNRSARFAEGSYAVADLSAHSRKEELDDFVGIELFFLLEQVTNKPQTLFSLGTAEGRQTLLVGIAVDSKGFIMTANGAKGEQSVRFDAQVDAEHWMHLSALWNLKAGFATLYLNGNLVGEYAQSAWQGTGIGRHADDLKLFLGGDPEGKNTLSGSLDEVQVYSTPLRQADVVASYLSASPSPTGLPMPASESVPPRKPAPLKISADVASPIISAWEQLNFVPIGKDGEPWIVSIAKSNYFEMPNRLYRPVQGGLSEEPEWFSEDLQLLQLPGSAFAPGTGTGPAFPRYSAPGPVGSLGLPRGKFEYVVVGDTVRAVNLNSLDFFEDQGEGKSPRFKKAGKIEAPTARPDAPLLSWGQPHLADFNGDGIPDIIYGTRTGNSKYWPLGGDTWAAWSGIHNPNMGSSTDYETIGNVRGYDIAGEWLGQRRPVRFFWSAGSVDEKGDLAFGALKEVVLGNTGQEVQWNLFARRVYLTTVERDGIRYLVILGENHKLLALPIEGVTKGGRLMVGAPRSLLRDDADLSSISLRGFIGTLDLNNDGKTEIIVDSAGFGRLTVLQGDQIGEFEEVGRIVGQGGWVQMGTMGVPSRIDWDGDGLPDVIIGDEAGVLSIFPGTEDPMTYGSPDFFRTESGPVQHTAIGKKNLQGPAEAAWSYLHPTVGDWDGDGNLDIITNDNTAILTLYRGKGSGLELEDGKHFSIGSKILPAAWRSRPAILDKAFNFAGTDRAALLYLDAEGDVAVAIPEQEGGVAIERVVKLPGIDGESIRLCGPTGLAGRVKFAVADWDGDGTWDIVFGVHGWIRIFFAQGGSGFASVYWMKNVGTASEPVFERPKEITWKDGRSFDMGIHELNVYPTDMNGNGELDLIIGEEQGRVYHFPRTELSW